MPRKKIHQPKTPGRRRVQAAFKKASKVCHAETTTPKAFGTCMKQEMRDALGTRRKRKTSKRKTSKRKTSKRTGCKYGKVKSGPRKGKCRKRPVRRK